MLLYTNALSYKTPDYYLNCPHQCLDSADVDFYQRLMKLIIHIQPLGYYRLVGHGRGLPRPFRACFASSNLTYSSP